MRAFGRGTDGAGDDEGDDGASSILPGEQEEMEEMLDGDPISPPTLVRAWSHDSTTDLACPALSREETRRIVLATNIAESSVTIPDVTVIVDIGLHNLERLF